MDAIRVPWNFSLPNNNVAITMSVCERMLAERGIPVMPTPDITGDSGIWCNATYDTVLCWPPTPANTSITLQCPPLKGLDPSKNITKHCHSSGFWLGRNETDVGPDRGWTNYTMCYTEEVIYIMNKLNNVSLGIAQEVAKNARKLEFVGLGLSLVCLIVSIFIFTHFRRLRVFRNMLHLHLMIAILMVVIIRLVLYIDLIFTGNYGPHQSPSDGKTINTMPFLCEFMYFLLEYFKTVAFGWMFMEGFVLHNQLVFTVFKAEPSITPYLITGYGFPLLHTLLWLFVVLVKKDFKVERCLGSYYLEPEFWILDGPRMLELVINFFFIVNVIRVLWTKVRESHNSSEMDRMKKSVKAALMLIPLLGIPNIMQTIPFAPTRDNIMVFAIWTYCASFTYMYQGLMITIIYCFTNKEVIMVIKGVWHRYRLQHTSQNELRRGSRSIASHYQARNGQVGQPERPAAHFYLPVVNLLRRVRRQWEDSYAANEQPVTTTLDNNNGSTLSPFSGRAKKGSDDSQTKLMLSVPNCEEIANNNVPSELTPLKMQCNDETQIESLNGSMNAGKTAPAGQ